VVSIELELIVADSLVELLEIAKLALLELDKLADVPVKVGVGVVAVATAVVVIVQLSSHRY